MRFLILIETLIFFCIFCLLVIYINYYKLALSFSRIFLLFISDIVDKPNFYVYLYNDKSYTRDFINTYESVLVFLMVILISVISYCEYFIRKKIYWSYFVALIIFTPYYVFDLYSPLYYFIAYCVAFCLALGEIKIFYILQNYLKQRVVNDKL